MPSFDEYVLNIKAPKQKEKQAVALSEKPVSPELEATSGAEEVLKPLNPQNNIKSDVILNLDKFQNSNSIFGIVSKEDGSALMDASVDLMTFTKEGLKSLKSTSTSDQGQYLFSQLNNGEYLVQVCKPGYITANSAQITLRGNQSLSENILLKIDSKAYTADLGGKITDGETGLPIDNIIVALYSIINSREILIKSTLTNNQGMYSFSLLPPGDYRIKAASFRKDDA
ncbi:MSCRAMM family protein [Clostridium polynesiense]|uniref:MSCRAMM family protein n=1 Tax=Clostridium polynesiense TaxID=1325933 RepID=UPI0005907BEF|nr:carboxypeptidase-like regulatory domain-containing protein [Clostridium polynesiense]